MAKSLSPLAKTKNGLTVHSWVSSSSKFTGKIINCTLLGSPVFNIYGQNFAFFGKESLIKVYSLFSDYFIHG